MNYICRLKNIYVCIDFKKGIDVYGRVYNGATTVLFSRMRLLNHPFGEVGYDSMINERAPHRFYATQDKLDKLVISSTMCS
jgi:hypothetical protein